MRTGMSVANKEPLREFQLWIYEAPFFLRIPEVGVDFKGMWVCLLLRVPCSAGFKEKPNQKSQFRGLPDIETKPCWENGPKVQKGIMSVGGRATTVASYLQSVR